MKIIYCASQLYKPGGTEKVLSEKANYLSAKTDVEVYIITEDQRNMPLCFELNENIHLIDINISSFTKKTIPGITFILNVFKLRKRYSKIISEINPDIVIVVERGYLDFVIPFINKGIIKIREFHFAKQAVKEHTKLISGFFNRVRHSLRYKILFNLFNRYDYLVLLTKRDQVEGKYKVKTKVIHNMINALPDTPSELIYKNVISVGSMYDGRKNFKEQILLWKDIELSHPDWKLNIYGDGKERENLQSLIEDNKLKNIVLHGNSPCMHENYNKSSVFLFTSQAEGFPMVLIEALSHGIPCIAYDAPTGPSDIILNNKTGFLVQNKNIKDLHNKLVELMDNESLRKEMGVNARITAKKYLPDKIMREWIDFFYSIKEENK